MASRALRRSCPRPPRGGQDGAVVVEFSIVFVLFATLIAGMIQYGVIFAAEQSLTHAASEAVRTVVNITDDNSSGSAEDEATTEIVRVIQDQLAWLDGSIVADDGRGVDYEITFAASCPDCVDVQITFNWEDDAIVPELLPIGTPSTLITMSSVRYQ